MYQKTLAKYDIASCKELYGEVFADNGNCATDLGIYEKKLNKKTLQQLCCASCSHGPGVRTHDLCPNQYSAMQCTHTFALVCGLAVLR